MLFVKSFNSYFKNKKQISLPPKKEDETLEDTTTLFNNMDVFGGKVRDSAKTCRGVKTNNIKFSIK